MSNFGTLLLGQSVGEVSALIHENIFRDLHSRRPAQTPAWLVAGRCTVRLGWGTPPWLSTCSSWEWLVDYPQVGPQTSSWCTVRRHSGAGWRSGLAQRAKTEGPDTGGWPPIEGEVTRAARTEGTRWCRRRLSGDSTTSREGRRREHSSCTCTRLEGQVWGVSWAWGWGDALGRHKAAAETEQLSGVPCRPVRTRICYWTNQLTFFYWDLNTNTF